MVELKKMQLIEEKYTYVGSNVSSLTDYVIMSEELWGRFLEFYISDPNILSVLLRFR